MSRKVIGMKNWLLIAVTAMMLAACNDSNETAGPTIKLEENVNEDVQSLVDFTEDDKFASFIYSETGTSYLLLNATGSIQIELEQKDSLLNIQITQKDDGTPNEIEDVVYALELDKTYDTIHLFENGEEIQFEIWYD